VLDVKKSAHIVICQREEKLQNKIEVNLLSQNCGARLMIIKINLN
jgi:hypothetical protein